MDKFTKGYRFAFSQSEKYGHEQTQRTMETILRANPGRKPDDPYVLGFNKGMADYAKQEG